MDGRRARGRGGDGPGTALRRRALEDVEGIEVDFFFPERKLVVEIDDPSHGRDRSRREDALERRVLEAAGYTLLRFTNAEVETRPLQVLRRLRAGA